MYLGALNAIPRELPSGYTQVEYIQSSGTQYIDTGFLAKNNTRIVASLAHHDDNFCVFGARGNGAGFMLYHGSGAYNRMYGSNYLTLDVTNTVGAKTSVDMNGASNTLTIQGKSFTLPSSSFSLSYPMYLFRFNDGGSLGDIKGSISLYSCQIYDNGTLVRDYVPCKNSSGTVGLYDVVNGVFYANAGTGTFTAGATIKSVARKFDSLYFGVANAVPRELPSGYTQVEYIQSSGTQYIDTGYAFSSENAKVEIGYEYVSLLGQSAILGSYDGTNFCFCPFIASGSNNVVFFAGTTQNLFSTPVAVGIHYNLVCSTNNKVMSVDFNGIKNSANYSGTIQTGKTMTVFADNMASGVTQYSAMKLKYCKMYQDDVLVRDFVPCKNASGTVGLYDLANGKFYENAGTGTFTAGTTTIASFARTVKKAYVGVNGLARLFYQNALPLASLPEGALVKLNESGSGVNFYLAKHNYESGQNGNGRTLMVRATHHPTTMKWHSSGGSFVQFNASTIHTWLNGTYKNTLDSAVQTLIGTTKYLIDASLSSKTSKAASSSVFLLSMVELGNYDKNWMATLGSALPTATTIKNSLGSNYMWTRQWSCYTGGGYTVHYISKRGSGREQPHGDNRYVRPVFTLPATAMVSASPNADGSYTLLV